MSTRYVSNLLLALAAGFLVIASQVFAAGAFTWILLGVAAGITVTGLGMLAINSNLQRVFAGLTAVLGAWSVVASLVFAPATVVWLGFASALAILGLGIAGMTAHELTTERVVHALDVDGDRASRGDRPRVAA